MIPFNDQLKYARKWAALSKRELIAELLSAHDTIHKCRQTLYDIVDLEEHESVQSYGFGDIARNALNHIRERELC